MGDNTNTLLLGDGDSCLCRPSPSFGIRQLTSSLQYFRRANTKTTVTFSTFRELDGGNEKETPLL